jgi:MerR family transcriptional regulator/heat shock protein HspR
MHRKAKPNSPQSSRPPQAAGVTPLQGSETMESSLRRTHSALPENAIKIGDVARHFRISADLLRLYEREGLLIPIRSRGSRRYFTDRDYRWISTLLRLVRQARLNFAGIRHLLALLPCWQIRACGHRQKQGCPFIRDATSPCWTNKRNCCKNEQDCYSCVVYRAAPECENLKSVLAFYKRPHNPPA